MKNQLLSQRGTSIVELVLSAFLLTMITVTVTQLLHKSSQAQLYSTRAQQATALADMVFEQYNSYARSNFAVLELYNTFKAEPKDFFFKPDNMGFDGLKLTTQATYNVAKSTCEVRLSVTWGSEGPNQTINYTRLFTEQTHLQLGAVMRIFTKSECNGYTDSDDIIANCPGVPGIEVVAINVARNSAVRGTTNSKGEVILAGVIPGDNISLTLTAQSMSDYSVPPSASGYRLGYYAEKPAGTFTAQISSTVVVDPRMLMSLLFKEFKPAGRLTGTVTGGVPGLEIRLGAPAIAYWQGTFRRCGVDIACSAPVASDLTYTFANVIPTTGTLRVAGRKGSPHQVQVTDPQFEWGYTGSSTTFLANDWSNSPPVATPILEAYKMGWVRYVVTKPDGSPAALSHFKFLMPGNDWTGNHWLQDFYADSNGVAILYNIFPRFVSTNPDELRIVADIASADKAFSAVTSNTIDGSWAGHENVIPVTLKENFTVKGTFSNTSGQPFDMTRLIPAVKVPAGTDSSAGTTDSDGNFTIPNFCASCMASTFPAQLNAPASVRMPSGIGVSASGDVVDYDNPLRPAPGAEFNVVAATYIYRLSSDANAQWSFANVVGEFFNYYPYNWGYMKMNCDDTTKTCTAPDLWPVDPTRGNVNAYDIANWGRNGKGWHSTIYGQPIGGNEGVMSTGVRLTARLTEFPVTGRVFDNVLGRAVPNLTIVDLNDPMNTVTTSADVGSEGTFRIWCRVNGRNSTSDGTIGVVLPPNQVYGSQTYPGATSGTIAVPSPANILAPVNYDFNVGSTVSSHI